MVAYTVQKCFNGILEPKICQGEPGYWPSRSHTWAKLKTAWVDPEESFDITGDSFRVIGEVGCPKIEVPTWVLPSLISKHRCFKLVLWNRTTKNWGTTMRHAQGFNNEVSSYPLPLTLNKIWKGQSLTPEAASYVGLILGAGAASYSCLGGRRAI